MAHVEEDAVEEPIIEEQDEAPAEEEQITSKEKDRDFMDDHGGSALRAMLSFFTVIRTDVNEADVKAMERNFYLAPLIGALYGLVMLALAVIQWKVNAVDAVFVALMLGIAIAGCRFLHFDGLVDFGDGMVCPKDREGKVNAMKDSRVGAGGIGVALITILISFSSYVSAGMFLILLAPAMEVLVKNAMVSAAAFGEPGNGMASNQVRQTDRVSMYKSTVITLGLVAAFVIIGFLIMEDTDFLWQGMALSVVATLLSVLVGYIMANIANRNFGMVNGDILGATNEIARASVSASILVIAAVLFTYMN